MPAADLLDARCAGMAFTAPAEVGLGQGAGLGEAAAWDALFDDRSAETHDPVVVEDASVDPRTAEWAAENGGGSLMVVPLVRGRERRGVLLLHCQDTRRPFSDRQVALAGTIGREVSLALENAHLLEQARMRAANLETIFRISQAVGSSLQSTVVLNRVLDVVQKILAAEAVSLMTHDERTRRLTTAMARGIPDRDMLYLELAPDKDIQGQVFNPLYILTWDYYALSRG
jgi:transcriptional regulator with GAF, ATPase, and Fis domain